MIVTDLVLTSAAALFLVATSGNRLAVSGEPVREYRPPETSADDGEGRGVGKETVMALVAEVAALKTMLSSVQGSLITSVGILQDQVRKFSKDL